MKRRSARSVTRKAASRKLVVLFVVVMEGKLTEAEYLDAFAIVYGNSSIKMRFVRGAGDPRSVVERAIEERARLKEEEMAGKDSVWAMFDRDEHVRFAEGKDLATGNNIPVAVSNPCFELWGIFHYRDFDRPIDRHDCQRTLEELCAEYDRHRHKSFASIELIRDAYRDAVRRGETSLTRRENEGDPGASPSTCVHLLTECFRQLVESVESVKSGE